MKHIATRLMVALFIVIGFIPVLVACGSEPEADPVCMGIVIGNRSNSEGVIGPMVAPLMPDPLPVGSVVVATEVSGSPAGDPVFTGTVTELENSYDQKDLQMNIRNGAIAAISSSAASSPQADTLGAIESTADKLKTSGLMGCEIHVYDSGLSTAGLIEFQQDLLARDPQTVIGQIPA